MKKFIVSIISTTLAGLALIGLTSAAVKEPIHNTLIEQRYIPEEEYEDEDEDYEDYEDYYEYEYLYNDSKDYLIEI